MKAALLLVLSAALCHTVNCSCTACRYDTLQVDCTDPFTPSGSVMNICSTVNEDLCSKYGDYAIYCDAGSLTISCKKHGHCSKADSSCTACKYDTPEADCTDPFTPPGPESEACDTLNEDLCSKYGDYAIYCRGSGILTSCTRRGECSSGTNPSHSSCTACKYGTALDDCRDPFTPSGSESEICDTINEDLCAKYGDYTIYCQKGGLSTNCKKTGQCVNEARSLTPSPVLISGITLVIKMAY